MVLENKESSKVKVSSENKKFYLNSESVENDEKAKDKHVFKIEGKETEFYFQETYKMGEKLLNKYEAENGFKLEISSETGEVVSFRTPVDYQKKQGDINEDTATAIAETLLCDLYGSNILNEYKHWQTNKVEKIGSFYAIAYSKYVHGILTTDDITICINMKGEIISVNALYKGTLAGIEKEVSQEDIESALAALKEFLGDSWTIDDFKQIVTDSEGYYYINAFIYRTVDGEPQSEQLYISLQ